ncbi:MAG: hypothetical protein AAGI69_21750 [Cyanobacteria bacterium P01_H01_bin.21]
MTIDELACLHPYLFHVTTPGAWASIRQHGLLSTQRLLELFDVERELQQQLQTTRRATAVPLHHAEYGNVVLNDNLPLSEKALSHCLDDGLTPEQWLAMLNERVFFWPDEAGLASMFNAKMNRNRTREVLVVETAKLPSAIATRMELCPINSGSTIRKPARRGLHTFTPLGKHTYRDWQKLRGRRDRIREVVFRGSVDEIENYVIDVRQN